MNEDERTKELVDVLRHISKLLGPLFGVFLRGPELSQTHTVWSIDSETMETENASLQVDDAC